MEEYNKENQRKKMAFFNCEKRNLKHKMMNLTKQFKISKSKKESFQKVK
jgi:hypothetical protein